MPRSVDVARTTSATPGPIGLMEASSAGTPEARVAQSTGTMGRPSDSPWKSRRSSA